MGSIGNESPKLDNMGVVELVLMIVIDKGVKM